MLIQRGMRTLLLGVLAVRASVIPDTDSQAQLSGRIHESTGWTPNSARWHRLRSRQEKAESLECPQDGSSLVCPSGATCCRQKDGSSACCGAGTTCCLMEDGSTGCCPVACSGADCPSALTAGSSEASPAAGGPTVLVTQTRTSTITVYTGAPTTSLVTKTNTIAITILNPTERTQTATVTATSFVQNARRSVVPEEALEGVPQGSRTAGNLEQRQAFTVTSTVTADVFTTVFRPSTLLATITNTVFTTAFVAPNAVTTVFVTTTTTVFVPAGAIPTTPAPTAVPTLPGSSSVPATPTTSPTPSTILPPPSTSSSTTNTPASTISSSTLSPSTSTSMVMETMVNSSVAPSPTTSATPAPSATPVAAPLFTTTQIIGLAVGSVLGALFLILLAFLLRALVRRRRAAQATMRQQLTPPEEGTTMTILPSSGGPRRGGGGPTAARTIPPPPPPNISGASSGVPVVPGPAAAVDNNSMLTGEGEVRIVIRPAPKRRTQSSQLWPMPPGHRGQTYSLFVEETTTTGETTPQDPGEWSIASERGSVSATNSSPGERRNYDVEGSNDNNGRGMRPSTSVYSAAWDRETSFGGRSEASGSGYTYPGIGTLLTPPPTWHGNQQSSGQQEMWGVDPADYDEDEGGGRRGGNGNGGGAGAGGFAGGSLGIGKAW